MRDQRNNRSRPPPALPRPAVRERLIPGRPTPPPPPAPGLGKALWPGFSSHPQVTWPNAERGVPAAPPPLPACSPPGRRTLWDGFLLSLSNWVRFPADGAAAALARARVGPCSRWCACRSRALLGNVSPGCNCSWLLVSGAGVQWPRCKSNKSAVFPMLLR